MEMISKAKRVDNNNWIEGYFYKDFEGNPWIRFCEQQNSALDCVALAVKIKPETLCHFTGVYDTNKVKIFTNDYDKYGNLIIWCDDCYGFSVAKIYMSIENITTPCCRCTDEYTISGIIEIFTILGNKFD